MISSQNIILFTNTEKKIIFKALQNFEYERWEDQHYTNKPEISIEYSVEFENFEEILQRFSTSFKLHSNNIMKFFYLMQIFPRRMQLVSSNVLQLLKV